MYGDINEGRKLATDPNLYYKMYFNQCNIKKDVFIMFDNYAVVRELPNLLVQ